MFTVVGTLTQEELARWRMAHARLNAIEDKPDAYSASDIEQAARAGRKLSNIAILVRASFQMRSFEERFVQLGIPYRVVGGPRFYERQEIRDALAYLRVIAQPEDDLAFERIFNKPKRGLGDAALQAVHKMARVLNKPLLDEYPSHALPQNPALIAPVDVP